MTHGAVQGLFSIFAVVSILLVSVFTVFVFLREGLNDPYLQLLPFYTFFLTSILFFGLQCINTVYAFFLRVPVFNLLILAAIVICILLPYALFASESPRSARQCANRVATLVLTTFISIIVLPLLQWSAINVLNSSLTLLKKRPDHEIVLKPVARPEEPPPSLPRPVKKIKSLVTPATKDANGAPSLEQWYARSPPPFIPEVVPTFDENTGFKFEFQPRQRQWFDEEIGPLEVPPPFSDSPLTGNDLAYLPRYDGAAEGLSV
ncbi:unnamed protein product [Somion occarium]|uniref:Uncharacterized protein n=1 Tax=Somion occarium TaxID=3059160 RepID=A0ABP1D8D2_9APHY